MALHVDVINYYAYIIAVKLDWDEVKRQQTLALRELDFADVERFDWDNAIFHEDQRLDYGEPRIVAFGFIEAVFVCVVYTLRGDGLRIISLRRANKRERKVYDKIQTADQ